MATIKAHLSNAELEARYKTAVDPIGKSHFHALWLLSCGYGLDELAELLSFSPRWVRALLKRYNEGGDTPGVLGAKNAYHSDLHVASLWGCNADSHRQARYDILLQATSHSASNG
jgi:hypothetical protein